MKVLRQCCRCMQLDWEDDSDALSNILLQSPDRQVTMHHQCHPQVCTTQGALWMVLAGLDALIHGVHVVGAVSPSLLLCRGLMCCWAQTWRTA